LWHFLVVILEWTYILTTHWYYPTFKTVAMACALAPYLLALITLPIYKHCCAYLLSISNQLDLLYKETVSGEGRRAAALNRFLFCTVSTYPIFVLMLINDTLMGTALTPVQILAPICSLISVVLTLDNQVWEVFCRGKVVE